MSSLSQNAGLDAPVTVKVFYDGATRRAKMPLREMAPLTLEKHVRAFLHIPDDAKITIERFSDSAAAYVLLDPANVSVYKQLYRAAKAKSKLKLRVTVLATGERTVPKPASVEDVPDSSDGPAAAEPAVKLEAKPRAAALSRMEMPLRPSVSQPVQPASPPADASAKAPQEPREWHSDFRSRMKDIRKTTDDLAGLASQLERQLRVPSPAAPSPKAAAAAAGPPKLPLTLPASLARSCPATGCGFAVCCNHCEKTIPGAHYHCSTCDDGDFDLCPSCVEQGVTCHSNDHWLIKRTMRNGQLVNSTTETIASKPKPKPEPAAKEEPRKGAPAGRCAPRPAAPPPPPASRPIADTVSGHWSCLSNLRTCNCCVQELPDREFVHCTACEDFDLCQACFAKDAHGHHPKHAFVPAVPGAQMPDHIKVKLSPGRNQMHHAICDGCDKYITGVRHKCLDCPDWDYCSACVPNAHFVHANHRFAPVYEPLSGGQAWPGSKPIHVGICCDGPLCSISQSYPLYIRGVRYKCAVCHDLDFCANCEASPANNHNKTHPLIKFKTPVRHVSVTTTGEHQDGKRMPAMGDRGFAKADEAAGSSDNNSINAVQTVVDVKPEEASPPAAGPEPAVREETWPALEPKQAPAATTPSFVEASTEHDLRAVFVRDSIEDGTILPPNHVFEQTWVLRNKGSVAWPAGCSVKFVGGDYMGHVDSAHPAGISELVSASESTVCYAPLAPGQEFSFTVLLRTPARAGKIISYWRLTTQDGFKFGHRLWCEVNVRPVATEYKAKEPKPVSVDVAHVEDVKAESPKSGTSSAMIFPKLEKESPSASMHEEAKSEAETAAEKLEADDGFEDCGEDEEWEASDDGFLTDEEYDILDASDEEFLEQQQKRV